MLAISNMRFYSNYISTYTLFVLSVFKSARHPSLVLSCSETLEQLNTRDGRRADLSRGLHWLTKIRFLRRYLLHVQGISGQHKLHQVQIIAELIIKKKRFLEHA